MPSLVWDRFEMVCTAVDDLTGTFPIDDDDSREADLPSTDTSGGGFSLTGDMS